jgi:hypothetical protein
MLRNKMEKKYETYAYFWVEGFDCDPKDIDEIMTLQATESYSKGDTYTQIPNKFREQGSWEYRSSLPRNEPFQDSHISNLIEVLSSRKEAIKMLHEKYEIGINCVGYYTEANPGFHLSAELIKACAELSLSIDFDLYTH